MSEVTGRCDLSNLVEILQLSVIGSGGHHGFCQSIDGSIAGWIGTVLFKLRSQSIWRGEPLTVSGGMQVSLQPPLCCDWDFTLAVCGHSMHAGQTVLQVFHSKETSVCVYSLVWK